MALFNSKKKETAPAAAAKKVTKAAKVAKKEVAVVAGAAPAVSHASVIVRPRITEKSGILSQSGVYTFEVSKNANKVMVTTAVKSLYKVTPIKVTMINVPAKNVFVRGRKGRVSGFRKALVTLKKGEKIDFV